MDGPTEERAHAGAAVERGARQLYTSGREGERCTHAQLLASRGTAAAATCVSLRGESTAVCNNNVHSRLTCVAYGVRIVYTHEWLCLSRTSAAAAFELYCLTVRDDRETE
jgi:hypothetical protein